MKKLILLLLFVPLVSFGQSVSDECKSIFYDTVNSFYSEIGNCSSYIDFDDVNIRFDEVDYVPRLLQCYLFDNFEARNCFQEEINLHIKRNLRSLGIPGRVYARVLISECGFIEDIRLRGNDKNLEKEVYRVIRLLPQMTPGKQEGRPVKVLFNFPIPSFEFN